jgi:hypothetical protein
MEIIKKKTTKNLEFSPLQTYPTKLKGKHMFTDKQKLRALLLAHPLCKTCEKGTLHREEICIGQKFRPI